MLFLVVCVVEVLEIVSCVLKKNEQFETSFCRVDASFGVHLVGIGMKFNHIFALSG